MQAERPRAAEAGLFLLVVAVPIATFPQAEGAYIDVKLVVLALGALLLLAAGLPVDRRFGLPAFAWAVAIVVAALAGIDPLESLIGTVRASGVVLLVCTAAIVGVAPSLPSTLLERARAWLVWTALAVAALTLIARLAPEILEPLAPRLSFTASTLGHPLRLAGFLAAAVPAILAERSRGWRTASALGLVALGLATIGERSAYVLPVIALAASAWFLRPGWRWIALAVATTVAAFALWALVPASAIEGQRSGRFSAAGQFRTLEGERQRLAVYGANVRAFAERPVLGWGPANAWSGFLSSGTQEQIETAGRNWADAHNIVLELASISGIVGLAAFGWLVARLAPRALRPPPARAWVAASAATLGAYALVEPLDVVLLPLLFLFAGAAAGREPAEEAAGRGPIDGTAWHDPTEAATPVVPAHPGLVGRIARIVAVAALAAATIVATVNLTASALEQWARTHAGSRWALRTSLQLAPWRITAAEALAIDLALDGRAGDAAAAAEARRVAAGVVEDHPWNPGVRLLAADVELLLRDVEGARAWVEEQLEVFPHDLIELPEGGPGTDLPA